MRYRDITNSVSPSPKKQALGHCVWQPRLQPRTTPYNVECDGLTRLNLTRPGEFERAYNDRRQWCETYARAAHIIEPIGPGPEQLTGRRFRFACQKTAALFKLCFPTDLWP
jgi:hypothetical protein